MIKRVLAVDGHPTQRADGEIITRQNCLERGEHQRFGAKSPADAGPNAGQDSAPTDDIGAEQLCARS